jgi:hypothetical protein
MRKAFADLRALGLGSLVVLACSQQSGLRSSPDAGKVDAGAAAFLQLTYANQ